MVESLPAVLLDLAMKAFNANDSKEVVYHKQQYKNAEHEKRERGKEGEGGRGEKGERREKERREGDKTGERGKGKKRGKRSEGRVLMSDNAVDYANWTHNTLSYLISLGTNPTKVLTLSR